MIRLLNFTDIDRVVELENNEIGSSLGSEMLKSYVDNHMCIAYVYEMDDMVIGYISCNFDGDVLEVCNICIDNKYQNQGLGTKLLDYALNEAKTKGAISSVIDVKHNNLRAIHVYEKLGYKRIHVRKGYYKTGEDAIVLQKLF